MAVPAQARALAARAVDLVATRGRALDDALAHVVARTNNRALVQEMVFGSIRHHFSLEALVRAHLRKPLKGRDSDIQALLRVGAYQLLHMRQPAHAAVDETVEATQVLEKPWAKGLVNAVLRALLREGPDAWRARIDARTESRYDHPAWLLAALQRDWPGDWEAICASNNARAPMTLRINEVKIARADYLAKLTEAGVTEPVGAHPDSAVTLAQPMPVEALPGFAEGWVAVQDAAAQYATMLLDPQPGERVLDACAAPGGKAAHILERAPGVELLALDIDAARLARVSATFARLGLAARTQIGDAATPAQWWDGKPFDRILLDAPCSGTGVIRRHPDIKLLRRPDDVPRMAATQARLLRALWPLLKPGGKLLYATCSILKEENDAQVAAFLATEHATVLPCDIPGGRPQSAGCQILPGERGMDGFYYACLEKP